MLLLSPRMLFLAGLQLHLPSADQLHAAACQQPGLELEHTVTATEPQWNPSQPRLRAHEGLNLQWPGFLPFPSQS